MEDLDNAIADLMSKIEQYKAKRQQATDSAHKQLLLAAIASCRNNLTELLKAKNAQLSGDAFASIYRGLILLIVSLCSLILSP